MFFYFPASNWPDLQLPMLAAGHLAGRCAASPTAAEVCSDIASTYRAHAGAEFPVYGYVPRPDAINLHC